MVREPHHDTQVEERLAKEVSPCFAVGKPLAAEGGSRRVIDYNPLRTYLNSLPDNFVIQNCTLILHPEHISPGFQQFQINPIDTHS
jgi:hypothetical protein